MSEIEHIGSILPRTLIGKKFKQYILQNMVVAIDTREKQMFHITDYLKSIDAKYTFETLKTADYAYMISDRLFTDLLIERKNSLEELSANITAYRERFERELSRAKEGNCRLILLVEDTSIDCLMEHKYKTRTSSQAFLATLLTYEERYGLSVQYMKAANSGRYIHDKFFYHVREMMINAGKN